MSSMKKAKIGNKLYEVTKLEEYLSNKDAYLSGYTCIEENGYLLPIVGQNSQEYGIIIKDDSPVSFVNKPPKDNKEYKADNTIDFGKVKDIKEMIETQDTIMKIENDILTTCDNITKYKINQNDAPEMIALKEAVNSKKIDLDKYGMKFGANYNNDKRLFNKTHASLPMIKRMCNALDMKCTLTLEDAHNDVPNPMGKGKKISVTLNVGGDDDNEPK